jgi:hypothetical protein
MVFNVCWDTGQWSKESVMKILTVSRTLLFGKKAKFIVTPKNSQKIGLGFAVKNYILDIIFITI